MSRPIDYRDLEVEISPAWDAGLEVRILRSLFNRPRGPFTPPFSPPEAKKLVAELAETMSRLLRAEEQAPELDPAWPGRNLVELGKQLYDALFREGVKETLSLCVGYVDGEREDGDAVGLRLRLSFDTKTEAVEAAAVLPWELLHDGNHFLAHDVSTPVVRYIDACQPLGQLLAAPPLRILLVAANPRSEPEDAGVNLEGVRRAILEKVGDGGDVLIEELPEPTLDALEEKALEFDPHVIQFTGHGGFDDEGGFLVFENAGGKDDFVTDEVLSSVLPNIPSLRVVILAACKGAMFSRGPDGRTLAGVAARLSQRGVRSVVGMQFSISVRAAERFSAAFYSALARREPLETAVTRGRLAIFMEREHSVEWAAPVLYLRSPQGHLFPPGAAGVAAEAKPETAEPRVIGVFSFAGWGKEIREEAKPEHCLNLVPYFKGRYIRNEALWPGVADDVARFLPAVVARDRENILEFAAHLSVAFAAGYSLEAMAGYRLALRQRGEDGAPLWRSNEGELPAEPLWKVLEVEAAPGDGPGLAVVLSLSQKATQTVRDFLRESDTPVRQLLVATLPKVSQGGVQSGKHAFALAEALHHKIRELRPYSAQGAVHLFPAGPTGFAFYLGRLARDWGPIQLWEYDRNKEYDRPYLKSILLGQGKEGG